MSLLLNDELMSPNNLLLDSNDPFKREPPNSVLGDINTGWWHRETSEEICQEPNEILLPILLFIDGGKVSERMSVEPVMFTLGIFKREIRNKAKAWRTLGYLENLDNSDNDLSQNIQTDVKLNDYHSMLKVILEDLKKLQGQKGGFEWVLELNRRRFQVVFKIAIQVVIGDCQGLDKVCGQYGAHNPGMKKLCRDCFVAPFESDDPNHICKFVKVEDVRGKSKKELKLMSMHLINNAFYNMYFGARTLSIFECTPPEPLHGILLGTVKYMYEEFEREISKETLKLINQAIRLFYREFSKQSSRNFPTIGHVQNGINNCNVLSAKEQYGRIFAIYLALMVPSVFESLSNSKRKALVDPTDKSMGFETIEGIGIARAKEWFLLMESTLTMYQWLMNPFHPPHTLKDTTNNQGILIESRAQRLVREYMHELKHLVGDRKGNGLRIVKFHQILHYVPEIKKDGSIQNIDSGRCESIALEMYKRNGKLTQKRQKSLTKQISQRHIEDIVMDEARRVAIKKCPRFYYRKTDSKQFLDNDTVMSCLQGSRYSFRIEHDETNLRANLIVGWDNPRTRHTFNPKLCLYIAKRLFFNTNDGGCLQHNSLVNAFTEYQDEQGNLYRAHPNYRSDGQWYDWCKIKWEGIDNPLPAKIICFIDLTSCTLMNENQQINLDEWLKDDNNEIYLPAEDDSESEIDDDSISSHENIHSQYLKDEYLSQSEWVVISSSLSETELPQNSDPNDDIFAQSSKISRRFIVEDRCRLVPISSIVGPCYCIPMTISASDEKCNEFIIVDEMKLWSSSFLPEE